MKKVQTYSKKITLLDPTTNLQVQGWEKTCPVCHKKYQTTSRTQKFCSTECQKKARSSKIKYTKDYDERKAFIRLNARSHSIGVEVLNILEHLNIIQHACSTPGCTNQDLECHHINLNPLDNRPENIQWLCTKCHHNIHTTISNKELKASSEFYRNLIN